MQKEGKLRIIKVINNFSEELKIENGKLLLTKKESGLHGIGITSVSKTAKKYGGKKGVFCRYFLRWFSFVQEVIVHRQKQATEKFPIALKQLFMYLISIFHHAF